MKEIKENETVIKKQRHVIDKITFLPLYLLPSITTPDPTSVLKRLLDNLIPTDEHQHGTGAVWLVAQII